MEPKRKAVTLPDGSEFEFFSPPVTLAQRTRAQKLAGDDNASNLGLQLLVLMAQDENGQKMFSTGDLATLKNMLPAELVESMMLQVLGVNDDEEEIETDPKSSPRSSRKTDS